jgi:hypothetical protein
MKCLKLNFIEMLLEKYLDLNNHRAEKSIVGLTKEQFLILSNVFDKKYNEMQNERLINGRWCINREWNIQLKSKG